MKTKVQVKDLKKGDELSSGTKIISDPVIGLKTPKGQMETIVKYPTKEFNTVVTWGKYTTVVVTNR